jgi:glycine/D-amino acid oxidase-like deaminating enzyme
MLLVSHDGVTTAYQLLRDGHEVVLLERQDAVARETNWGNAGMIAPGHSFVWSSPLCQTSCRLNRIGTLGARIAESGSIRTSVQGPDSGEAVAAGEFVGGARIA